MAGDKDVSLTIGLDDSDLRTGMERAASVVRSASSQMQSSMAGVTDAFKSAQGVFAAFTAVLAGGAAFRAAIDAVKEQTAEAMSLARTLGITSEEANVLNTALGNVFLDKDTYISGMQAVTKSVAKNGAAFTELGIQTKDAQGKLLPYQQIIGNTIAVLDTYKAGVDRNVMANQLLGKSYDDVLKLSKVNEQAMADAAQEVADYHKTLDPAMVTAYKQAMENMGDAAEGVTLAVGRGVMPIMTELGNWLQQAGPTATEVMIVAMDSLRDVYDTVKGVAVSLWETVSSAMSAVANSVESVLGVRVASASETAVNAMKLVRVAVIGFGNGVQTAFELARGGIEILVSWWMRLSNVASAALRLDFDGARLAWQAGAAQLEAIVSASAARIYAINQAARDKMAEAMEPGVTVKGGTTTTPTGGTRTATQIKAGKEKKEPAEKSRMGDWEAELAAKKSAFEQQSAAEGAFHQYTLSQELAFWEQKQGIARAGTAEAVATQKKVADLRLQLLRKGHEEELQIDALNIERAQRTAMAGVDADEQAARLQVALGRATDEEMLQQEQAFEERRHAIRLQALQEKFLLAAQDPERNKVELAKQAADIEQLETEHQLKLQEIRNKIAVANASPFSSFFGTAESAFGQFFNSALNRTATFGQAMSNLYRQMAQSFINDFIVKKTMALVADQAKELAMRSSTLTALFGLESGAAVKGAVIKKAEAAMTIPADAAMAAGSAAAAVAGIPVVGPALAATAFAETMAMVMSGLAVASASGGYDIPAGVNPLVQTHAEEMILPAQYANVIRDMAEGGGGGGGAFSPVLNVQTFAPRDLIRELSKGGAVAKALAAAHRDFVKVR